MVETRHPELKETTVRCAGCGTSFRLRSAVRVASVEVCAACHPAYTGVQRQVAAGSRVDRFNRRWRGVV
jgi:large subunit ribosomal protein L31